MPNVFDYFGVILLLLKYFLGHSATIPYSSFLAMQITLWLLPGDQESALTARDVQFNPAVLFSSADFIYAVVYSAVPVVRINRHRLRL